MTVKYVLTLTPAQAATLIKAADVYAALKIGRLRDINLLYEGQDYTRHSANRHLDEAKDVIFPRVGRGGTLSIFNAAAGDGRTAWDIYQVLRHAKAWHENPKGGIGVIYDPPMQAGEEPVPTVEIIEDDE